MSNNKKSSFRGQFNRVVAFSLASVLLAAGSGCSTTQKYKSAADLKNTDLVNKAENEVYEGYKAKCDAAFSKEYEGLKAKWQKANSGNNIPEFKEAKKRYEECLKGAGLPEHKSFVSQQLVIVDRSDKDFREQYYIGSSGTVGKKTTTVNQEGHFTFRTETYTETRSDFARYGRSRNAGGRVYVIDLFGHKR